MIQLILSHLTQIEQLIQRLVILQRFRTIELMLILQLDLVLIILLRITYIE